MAEHSPHNYWTLYNETLDTDFLKMNHLHEYGEHMSSKNTSK